jgi:cobaltochelatase CobN
MKLRAVISWPSVVGALVEAVRDLDYVDLKIWSMKDLGEREEECLNGLSDADVMFLNVNVGHEAWSKMEPALSDVSRRIPTVFVPTGPSLVWLGSVDAKVTETCLRYFTNGGPENLRNMVAFMAAQIMGLTVEINPPRELPRQGIYHPDAPDCFDSLDEYLAWYKPPGDMTAGLVFYRSYWVNGNCEVEKALIRELENQGIGVVPVFTESVGRSDSGSLPTAEVVSKLLMKDDGAAAVDALVNLQFAVLSGRGSDGERLSVEDGVRLLRKLDVPVFHPIVLYSRTEEEWRSEFNSVNGGSIGWAVAMPEFEGMIEPIVGGVLKREKDEISGVIMDRYGSVHERAKKIAGRIKGWINLRKKPVDQRRAAFILHNNPCVSVEASVGGGAHLDTLESVARILESMEGEGYAVEGRPENGKELITTIMDRKAISEFRWTTVDEIVSKGGALAQLSVEEYRRWFDEFPERIREKMIDTWGAPPGEELNGVPAAMVYDGKVLVTGVRYGNAAICVQPKRGCAGPRCDGKVCKILHDPEIPPPHQYLATYRYLENHFGADVIIHVGTHGNLEFLPGKPVALSESCLPDIAIGSMPHLYIYNADNPPEGTIAKRRSYACLVDHMQTVLTGSGLYDALEDLEKHLADYNRLKDSEPGKAHSLEHFILDAIKAANLEKELGIKDGMSFDRIVEKAHETLTLLRNTRIADGMHILGEYPQGARRADFISSIVRFNFGDGISSRRIILDLMGIDIDYAHENPAVIHPRLQKTYGEIMSDADDYSVRLVDMALDGNGRSIFDIAREILGEKLVNSDAMSKLPSLDERIVQISRSIDDSKEIENLLEGFAGRFIPPGPSGLITRGRPDVLPTGRNFYSLDPETIPTRPAWKVGVKLADTLLERHRNETGSYPENMAMMWMASDIMWADGEEMCQLMHLIGTRPLWSDNGRVRGFEVLPLEELNRPRVDVTVRVSGITRDCFPGAMDLLDEAIQAVAALDEPLDMNYVRKHTLEQLGSTESPASEADMREATLRLFTSRPGTYGNGVNLAVYASAWKDESDLSEVYIQWNGYGYGKGVYGKASHRQLVKQLKSVDLTFNKVVSDEYDLLGCCCYFATQGGMSAAARHVSGKDVKNYYGDTRDPEHVSVRDLADELKRVVRTRLLNPKWIEGMKRHGYKGAGDISKRVGRVYGWEATTGEVDDWVFDDIAKTFILDDENRKFFQENNPWALEEIGRRLLEAYNRELWKADESVLEELKERYLETESCIEEKMDGVTGEFQGGAVDVFNAEEVADWDRRLEDVRNALKELKS